MFKLNHSSFHHFVQEVNEIWCLRSLIIALPGHQDSLTICTKWWNGKWLKVSTWSKLFYRKCPFFKMRSRVTNIQLKPQLYSFLIIILFIKFNRLQLKLLDYIMAICTCICTCIYKLYIIYQKIFVNTNAHFRNL